MRLRGITIIMLLATPLAALETEEIEIRDGATNDGRAKIFRTGNDLFFQDASTSEPVSLSSLTNSLVNHGSLTNLGNDDHPQYLNSTRHTTTHSTSFNNSMPVGPDINDNTTLLEHLSDDDIHPDKTDSAEITGDWTFSGNTAISSSPLQFFSSDTSDDVTFELQGQNNSASITFDDSENQLVFSNPAFFPEVISESNNFTSITISEKISGLLNASPTAVIEDYDMIEGIATEDLVSKSVDESVTGEWNFLSEVDVSVSEISSLFSRNALEVLNQAFITTDQVSSNRKRSGLFSQSIINIDADHSMPNSNFYGVFGEGNLQFSTNSNPSGFVSGVGGVGYNVSDDFKSIGVLGAASSSSSNQDIIGILGSDDTNVLTNTSLIPSGTFAGVFLGNVSISDTLEVADIEATSIQSESMETESIVLDYVSINYPTESLSSVSVGDVVDWGSTGKIQRGISPTLAAKPYAGVALMSGSFGSSIEVAISGVANVTCNHMISIGDRVTWNGTSIIKATSAASHPRTIGTALGSHNGSGTVTIPIQINSISTKY